MDAQDEDIKAKREARRRKILENAKNRLDRISGRESEATENGMYD